MAQCTSRHTRITLALIFGLISLFLAMPATHAAAAEFSIRPSIAISQEYSDNIDQERDKRSAFTTKVMPGIAAAYKAPVWEWNLNYGFEYSHFTAEKTVAGGERKRHDYKHTLAARGLVNLIENLFFLQVSNVYERADLNVVRSSGLLSFPDQEVPEEEQDLLAAGATAEDIRDRESSDRNTFSVSPYFAFQPTARTTLRTGYKYTNTWYREDVAENSHTHQAFVDAGYQVTTKWGLDAGYSAVWETEDSVEAGDQNQDELRHNVYAGTSYVFSPATSVFGQIGTTWRDRKDRETTSDLFWNAGLRHALGKYIATLMTTVRYVDDPLLDNTRKETVYTAGLTRPYERGAAALTASYSEFDDPKATKYLAGTTLNHSLTQRLSANAGLFAERRKTDNQARVDEWRALFGLSYLVMQDMSASLNYRYTDSSSQDDLSDDNFQENRVILEVRKTF